MENPVNHQIEQIYVIMNPVAGHADMEATRSRIDELCQAQGWKSEIHETTGDPDEDISELTRAACKKGADLVIAAGGDGTVAGVVNGLINTGVPLGIIPAGTGNGLARAMRIPLELDGVMALFGGEYTFQEIDAMQVGERYYVLNVSAGISSRSMDKTAPEDKQKLGVLAYAQTIIKDALEHDPLLFRLSLDGHEIRVHASEVLISNGDIRQEPPFLFGPRETFNDGVLNVNILTAASPSDYLRLVWDMLVDPQESKEQLRDLSIRTKARLDVDGEPQPVQADGEVIGQTPVELTLVPRAVKVLVPVGDKNGK